MKYILTLLMSVALASSALAGPMSAPKNPKAPVLPPPPAGCDCFGPGMSFDVFGAGFFPEGGGDEAAGGGVGMSYFFTRNLGIDLNYSLFATSKEHHQFDGNLVLRAPIDSLCIAPYLLAGGGFATNSNSYGTYQAGAGIDIRLQSMNCLGIFAEGLYHFANDEAPDFTTVRLGVRIPF